MYVGSSELETLSKEAGFCCHLEYVRVNRLAESSTRRNFQLELSHRFSQMRCSAENGVERVWEVFRYITEATGNR